MLDMNVNGRYFIRQVALVGKDSPRIAGYIAYLAHVGSGERFGGLPDRASHRLGGGSGGRGASKASR